MTVSNGGSVMTDGQLLAGDPNGLSGSVMVALEAGSVAAGTMRFNPGSVLAGHGSLEGLAGASFLQMVEAELRPGDRAGSTGNLSRAVGSMDVTGNIDKDDGAVWFDIGSDGHDTLTVDGTFSMSGGTIHARWLNEAAALGDDPIRLIEASGGVVLDAVTHDLMSDAYRLAGRRQG